jgi:ABC-type antimicrobial peptide transport system permease subunit
MNYFKEAFKGLLINKSLTLLMFLGVFISTLSISSIIIISNGAKHEIVKVLKGFGFGYDSILILAGPGKLFAHQRYKTTTLKLSDAMELQRLEFVKGVSPFNRLFSITSNYKSNSLKVGLLGVYPQFATLHGYSILYGRFITEKDVKEKNKVCVIGKTVVNKLLKSHDLNQVGKFISIRNIYFKIVGVYKPKGASKRFDIDRRIFIPLSIYNNLLFHQDYLKGMKIVVNNVKNIDEYVKTISNVLRKLHSLGKNQPDDFRLITSKDIISFVNRSTNQLTKLLFGISLVSFFVSGLTILNIMLTSVFKRIREIGIRRACGASKKHILSQFLFESIITALTGTIVGVLTSVLFLVMLSGKLNFKIFLNTEPFLISFFFGITVGTVFGFIPALKAANIDPIKAIND